nr:MAG TPA: hypothetical protein [Caudoviricetes sp.]
MFINCLHYVCIFICDVMLYLFYKVRKKELIL